jgi:hypothetical protein
MTHQAWNVYFDGDLIDTVFYDADCDADYVKRGLVAHDGYNPGIVIRRDNRYNAKATQS